MTVLVIRNGLYKINIVATLESGIDVAPGKLDQIQIEKINQPWKSLANGKNPKIYECGKVYSGL